MKRFKLIGCKVMTREIGFLLSTSPNYIDTTWLRQGFHNEPDILRATLQAEINKIELGDDPYSCNKDAGDYDAILLCYGLCSNGVCDVKSSKYTLVIPKAHDCITLLLGSKERYRKHFDKYSGGIYWYTTGWIENCLMPSKQREDCVLDTYKKTYGEENAQYLLEMESGWLKEYKAAAFICHDEIECVQSKRMAKQSAMHYNWEYIELKGELKLLSDLVNGNWDSNSFLVVPPNKTITQSFNDDIIMIKK